MKRIMLLITLIAAAARGADAPFHRGVNLTNWLQASSTRQIQFSKFTMQDFVRIQSLGCDVVRLPINLHFMTGGAPDYTVDPLFFNFLDQIVDWTEALGIHLLLDNHTFDPAVSTSDTVGNVLVPVWTQMASHFRERSKLIYYEVLNEPHGISDKKWNEIQLKVIQAIRAVDTKHSIVIGPSGWNGYNNLALMPQYADTNLIYTFHFYDPFIFTHQGASWTDPSLVPLAGVPFPFDAARMPACPQALKGTWIESSLAGGYRTEGTVKHVKELIDIAVAFKTQRKVPLFCGEFGVYIPNSPPDDRVFWYRTVREYLEEKGISWTIWDYTGGFGLFKKGSAERFDYDINVPLVEALGLTPPPQKEYTFKPDSAGFVLYDDYIGPGVFESSWAIEGVVDFYSETDPAGGRYCIYWTGVPQYSNIGFAFKPVKDMTCLVGDGSTFDFRVRGDSPGAKFDVRFIDTKTDDPNDHPWRMRLTIDETLAAWDGEWKHLRIPLSRFTEHGSWDDNQWFNPQGLFDWAAADRFEIVSEHQDLKGIQFWFDDVRVTDPLTDGVNGGAVRLQADFSLEQNYPNPFNPETTIRYRLSEHRRVEVAVYNAKGQKVRSLVSGDQPPGRHSVVWDGRDDSGLRLSSGIYFYRMKASGFNQIRKMVLLY
jgi:endoglucanase